jgi:hypothetical protein
LKIIRDLQKDRLISEVDGTTLRERAVKWYGDRRYGLQRESKPIGSPIADAPALVPPQE